MSPAAHDRAEAVAWGNEAKARRHEARRHERGSDAWDELATAAQSAQRMAMHYARRYQAARKGVAA